MDGQGRCQMPGLLRLPLETLWGISITAVIVGRNLALSSGCSQPVQRCMKGKVDRHQGKGINLECPSIKRRKLKGGSKGDGVPAYTPKPPAWHCALRAHPHPVSLCWGVGVKWHDVSGPQ